MRYDGERQECGEGDFFRENFFRFEKHLKKKYTEKYKSFLNILTIYI